ncbi:MAG: hypothetical protein WCY64_02885 [Candidatus Cloacimonadaceae bacterium]
MIDCCDIFRFGKDGTDSTVRRDAFSANVKITWIMEQHNMTLAILDTLSYTARGFLLDEDRGSASISGSSIIGFNSRPTHHPGECI